MNRRNFLKWFGIAPAAPIAAAAASKIDDRLETVINQLIDQKNLESRPRMRVEIPPELRNHERVATKFREKDGRILVGEDWWVSDYGMWPLEDEVMRRKLGIPEFQWIERY